MSLHRLVYTSIPREMTPRKLADIIDASRRNNAKRHLTGFLLSTNHSFLQVVEGDPRALSERLIVIGADPRHQDLHIRAFEPIDERAFPDWGMRLVTFGSSELSAYARFFPRARFEPGRMAAPALVKLTQAMARDAAAD